MPTRASPPLAKTSFALGAYAAADARYELRLEGELKLSDAGRLWVELQRMDSATGRGGTLDFDMSRVQSVDGGAMALLASVRANLHRRGVKSEFTGAKGSVQEVIHLYGGDLEVGRLKRRLPQGLLDQIGESTLEIVQEVQLVLAFFGQMVVTVVKLARNWRGANWKELAPTMERSGANAVPIVVLINFLVGLAMAFQAAAQLKRFGAQLLVADLIGISVTRELAPLMTAIVICGRSGAAFAAELGFMQVNEEVDALRTMGFGPMRFLVVPRTVALILVVPMLTLVADLFGILGGLLVGILNLDLTITGYFHETVAVVSLWDVASGLIKSVFFALAISLIACQQGLATTGGAEGVGRRTTATVVVSLFTLVLVDSIFTVFFRLVES